MKILIAEQLPHGDRHFVIEVEPATEDTLALTEEFTWGADVPIEVARREMKLLLTERHGQPKPAQPAALAGLIGKSL